MKFSLVVLILIFAQAASGAEIHSWTDKDGRKHFTDTSPSNSEAESTSTIEILSDRTLESMRNAIDIHKGKIFAKYMKALKRNPSLNGKCTVKLSVAPSGVVNQASLIKSDLGDPEFESEILSEFKAINFGKERVKETSITYPIAFFPL